MSSRSQPRESAPQERFSLTSQGPARFRGWVTVSIGSRLEQE